VASELRAFRIWRGISIPRLAKAAGVSAGFISELERGLKRPRRETVGRLDRVLHFDDFLLGALWAEAAVVSAYVPPSDRPPGWAPQPPPVGDCRFPIGRPPGVWRNTVYEDRLAAQKGLHEHRSTS
jgi:transcriptional regulator with XRE-family HTH domain